MTTYQHLRDAEGHISGIKWPLRCHVLGYIARLLKVQIFVDGYPLNPLPKRLRSHSSLAKQSQRSLNSRLQRVYQSR